MSEYDDLVTRTRDAYRRRNAHVLVHEVCDAIESLQSRLAAVGAERDELVKAVRRNWGARPIPADLARLLERPAAAAARTESEAWPEREA